MPLGSIYPPFSLLPSPFSFSSMSSNGPMRPKLGGLVVGGEEGADLSK